MSSYHKHRPVLLDEAIEFLLPASSSGNNFADLTFGGGGHSFALLEANSKIHLLSFDQDPEAIANGREQIKTRGLEKRISLVHSNFSDFAEVVRQYNHHPLDAVLADLGVSSHHFDAGGRGFSFRFDAPLDMRMNPESGDPSAYELIKNSSAEELAEIFYRFGEEPLSRRIAEKIKMVPDLKTTRELAELVSAVYPKRHHKIHPATKVFQALRIVVNRELEVLETMIEQVIPLLRIGGRLGIITFHSLEDRIVKETFKKLSSDGEYPCQLITNRAIKPSLAEISENSRARSAKLRVIERTKEFRTKNKYAQYSKI